MNYIQARNEGLNESVLYILQQHVGIEHAISRTDLIDLVNGCYVIADERDVRQAVHDLRHDVGYPICSIGGTGGGYWWEPDVTKLYAYHSKQIDSVIKDLAEQKRAQVAYAVQNTAIQPHLLEV
jgi:hypothetical protein